MAKTKEQFVVLHGVVKAPHPDKKPEKGEEHHAHNHQVVGVGEVVHLDPDDAKLMDPTGATLMPKLQWDAEQAGTKAAEKAKADVLAKAAEKAKEHTHGKGGGK